MKRAWRIQSGSELSLIVVAETMEAAFIKALDQAHPRTIGHVYSARDIDNPAPDDDAVLYARTDTALQRADRWHGRLFDE